MISIYIILYAIITPYYKSPPIVGAYNVESIMKSKYCCSM